MGADAALKEFVSIYMDLALPARDEKHLHNDHRETANDAENIAVSKLGNLGNTAHWRCRRGRRSLGVAGAACLSHLVTGAIAAGDGRFRPKPGCARRVARGRQIAHKCFRIAANHGTCIRREPAGCRCRNRRWRFPLRGRGRLARRLAVVAREPGSVTSGAAEPPRRSRACMCAFAKRVIYMTCLKSYE